MKRIFSAVLITALLGCTIAALHRVDAESVQPRQQQTVTNPHQ